MDVGASPVSSNSTCASPCHSYVILSLVLMLSHLSVYPSVLDFLSPPLFLPAVNVAWVNNENSTSTCIKEFYTAKEEKQWNALSNCYMVGELRAFHERITLS